MSAPLGSIRTWSDVQLTEDVNDEDGVSATKYNERQRRVKACKEEVERRAWEEAEQMAWEEVEWRVEVERRKAEEQAKKRVSRLWLAMTELTVIGGGDHCTTAWQGQGEGIRGTGLPMVPGLCARV